MNTRIQVEHPVTEMLYGVDLVAEQIHIAGGGRLTFRQKDLVPRGHAIECRINAEDPSANFAPAAGTLESVVLPGGSGVRVDSFAYAGFAVPPYYDSLLAKIIVHAKSRSEALAKMDVALRETYLGPKTTVGICRTIIADEAFAAGGVGIDFLPALLAKASALREMQPDVQPSSV